MKITLNIFAILLTLLISLPTVASAFAGCDAESGCCEETTVPTEEDSHDGCMSICFCSCCSTSVFFNDKKEKTKTTVEIPSSVDVFIYSTPLSKNITAAIWHPPQSI